MSVTLRKGQKVSLTKDNDGLNKLFIGCGWDENLKETEKKGLFNKVFSRNNTINNDDSIDVDASVIVCRNGKFSREDDLVYFGHLRHESGAIIHTGDNLTGEGEGDDEVILITLDKLPNDCDRLIFVANIYNAKSKHQNFGMISNAFIRIVDNKKNEELCRYNISDDVAPDSTALIFGEVYKKDNEWKFNAIGQGTKAKSVKEMCAAFK